MNRSSRVVSLAIVLSTLCYLAPAYGATEEMQKIYRKYYSAANDYLTTFNNTEGDPYWVNQGNIYMYTKAYGVSGGAPQPASAFYRCINPSGHHYIAVVGCAATGGYVDGPNNGLIGYVLSGPRSGFVPFYYCYRSSGVYFVTTASNCEGIGSLQYVVGYVLGSFNPPHQISFGTGPSNDCRGRCGMGCSGFMPFMNIYTAECRAHDDCVAAKGLMNCFNTTFLAAAISYQVNTYIVMGKAIGRVVSHVLGW